jgi:two-component system response regulator NreC
MSKSRIPAAVYDLAPGLEVPRQFFNNQTPGTHCTYLASCTEKEFLYVSESFHEVTGYAEKELKQGLQWWFSLVHPDDIDPMLAMIFQFCFLRPASKRFKKPFSLQYRIKQPGGGWAWILETKCIVSLTEHGKNELILGRLEAIGDIKRKEQSQLEKILEEEGKTNPLLRAAIPVMDNAHTRAHAPVAFTRQLTPPEDIVMPTKRELEILHLIGDGYSTKQIAEKLYISINTVETHRRHLLEKIGVKNSMELIKQTTNAFWLKKAI